VKRLLLIALSALIVSTAFLAALGWHAWTTGPSQHVQHGPSCVNVPRGASLRQVVSDLHRRGLLDHPRLFLLGARLARCGRNVQVGRYDLPAGASPRDLLQILCHARPMPIVVTLPEGMQSAALAGILADSLQLSAAAILDVADGLILSGSDTLMRPQEKLRLERAISGSGRPDVRPLHWCEGYMAPDTYHFAPLTGAADVARAVVGLQLERLNMARASAASSASGFSMHELLTMASLVEAEAHLPQERGLVAAVFHNRLLRGMRLEADPTVAFWLGKRGQRLLHRDLEVDSPYNTYRSMGLPAGPIGNPGLQAVLAAARPDTASMILFFVADGEGGHIFSKTLAEHEQAVARYRRLMRDRR
jgi:UPF0755 protein